MGTLRALWRRIDAHLQADLLHEALDVECPHDPLRPCEPCSVQAMADRW